MSDSRYRVLIVDDDAHMRGILSFVFGQNGFCCQTASDGNDAETLLGGEPYDAVVSDLRMPNKHGHALATQVLAMEPRPVIVIHTGLIEPKLARDLLARGVDDIVFKPYDLGLLTAKVKSLIKRKTASPELAPAL
jgi:DNA-binding response OmpR family regulator